MSEQVSPPPLPGDTVGQYVLRDLVGVGGMATVYRATDPNGAEVAVKILHPGKAQTDEIRRFRREFLALQQLEHPGVVQVFEAGGHGEYPWIALEYVDGVDLGTLVDRWAADPPADRFDRCERILRGLCDALAYVHGQGLIHRDLKPSNVLVDRKEAAKLTDFGVVKAPSGAFTTQLTVAGRLVGTVAFMAPEQITGDPVDARSDLYSLGAVLYVMLTSRRPIEADTIAGYLARHLTENPRAPSELDPQVPQRLERICLQLLRKEPGQRPPSAEAVLEMLDAEVLSESIPVQGRDNVFDVMHGQLMALDAGAGGVTIIVGPPGSGRSVLLDALAERARSAGHRVAHARSREGAVIPRLAAQLTEGNASETLTNPGDLGEMVVGASSVLLVDDLDAVSFEEVEFLTRLVRDRVAIEGEPTLLICALSSVDGSAAGLCTGVATGLTPDRIDLEGIDRRATVALVRDRGLGGAAAAVLGNRLFSEFSGLPGAVVEQIQTLIDAGWLEQDVSGNLKLVRGIDALRGHPLPLPRRVREQETVRLSGLSPDARFVFDALVILDMESSVDLVGLVTELEAGAVDQALETLVGEGLAHRRVEGMHEVVKLTSDRYRDVAYALIEPKRRVAMHRSAAAALRRRNRRRTGSFAGVIAAHLMSGGQKGEAFPLLLVAAQQTLRRANLDATKKLLRQASDARIVAEPTLEPRDVVRYRRMFHALEGEVLERCGDLPEALTAWRNALEAAREEGEPEAEARALAGLGLVRAARGDPEHAVDSLEPAVKRLARGDPMWPRAAQALANARLVQGQPDAAESLWRQLIDVGREMGAGAVQAEALAGIGRVALVRGDLAAGRDALEQAVFRLRDNGSRVGLVRVLLRLSELAWIDGRLEEALARAIDGNAVSRDIPRVIDSIRALGIAAQVLIDIGRDDEARTHAQEGAALARARGVPQTGGDIMKVLPVARALGALGALEDAGGLLPPSVPEGLVQVRHPGIDDPAGGLLALRARLLAPRHPSGAVVLAHEALARPPATLPWAAARITLDCAHALSRARDASAGDVVLQVLEIVSVPQMRLLELEARLQAVRCGLGGVHVARAEALCAELDAALGHPPGFVGRWSP